MLLFAFESLERTGSAPQSWYRIKKADQIGESGLRSLEKRLAVVLGTLRLAVRPRIAAKAGRRPAHWTGYSFCFHGCSIMKRYFASLLQRLRHDA